MQVIRFAVLYTAIALGANATLAETPQPDAAALDALRIGDMQKLVFTDEPVQASEGVLLDQNDEEHLFSSLRGKYLLVNFWATWCAPCRAELSSLDRLQGELGGENFAVVTIATGPNPLPAIQKLFAEDAISNLPILRDPHQAFARDLGVLALPVSVLIDPEGNEIGRLLGDAHWDSPEAKALLIALTTKK